MDSVNAFARRPISLPTTDSEHPDVDARRSKRPRLADDAFAAIQTRSAHQDTSLEVDHMILDFTVYHTIKACLASRNHEQQTQSSASLSACLSMSEAYLCIFKARHPTYKADPELKFRIKLLKLATLFTQRLTLNPTTPSESSLDVLRESNRYRARDWIGDAANAPSSIFDHGLFFSQSPLCAEECERNRVQVLQQLNIPPEDHDTEDAFYGTSAGISLLDILPVFLEVTAARNAMNASNLSDRWMHLASDFMLQACLEQYLVAGAEGLHVIDEAFSWGYRTGSDLQNQQNIGANNMFEDEDDDAEVEGWSAIKTSYLRRLLQPDPMQASGSSNGERSGSELATHLETVAAAFPILEFEESTLQFLDALSKSISQPVLAQLEGGKLDGLTEDETKQFLVDCGINMARNFEA